MFTVTHENKPMDWFSDDLSGWRLKDDDARFWGNTTRGKAIVVHRFRHCSGMRSPYPLAPLLVSELFEQYKQTGTALRAVGFCERCAIERI